VLLSASVFIYFKEYSDTEQSLFYPSEKLLETVGTAVALMESMMAEVAHASVLCCSNMSGTDKQVLVIGKRADYGDLYGQFARSVLW
jgi:hypothetical protein